MTIISFNLVVVVRLFLLKMGLRSYEVGRLQLTFPSVASKWLRCLLEQHASDVAFLDFLMKEHMGMVLIVQDSASSDH